MRYSSLKIFRFPEKLATLSRENPDIRPPLHIRIKPTNVCTHHCRYCSYRADGLQLGKDMRLADSIPRAKMLEIVGDVVAMGVKAVTFSGGGDPFCYRYLAEAAERLAESPVSFAALTNGSQLCGPASEVFAQAATWLRVSMDGWDSKSYARYRNLPEQEFGRVIENIRLFCAQKHSCRLGVNLIVDSENAPHVHEFIAMTKDLGADSIKVSPCIVSDRSDENNRYHQPLFASVDDQIRRAKAVYESDSFEIYHAYHLQEVTFEKPYVWCPYAQILPVIGADQRVYTCQDKAYNRDTGLLGSIEHQRFADFWFGDKTRFMKVNPACDCNHHCVADRKNRLILEYLALDEEDLGFV